MTSRVIMVVVGIAGGLTWAMGSCGSDDGGLPGETHVCNTPGCLDGSADAPADQVLGDVVKPDAPMNEGGSGATLSNLCGEPCGTTDSARLFPGDPGACKGVNPSSFGGAGGGVGGAAVTVGCAVVRGTDDKPESVCILTGQGENGDPCVSASDCAAGYACVGQDNAGLCRPYCCGDPESCPRGMFCTAQPQFTSERGPDSTPLEVPVCVEHSCRLDEPYPCPTGETCACDKDLACTVVRADGTTGCVTPGEGVEGEPCPCAPTSENSLGFVCSQAAQKCVKLCAVAAQTSGCGAGSRCQASAALPDGFGTCTTSFNGD